MPPWLSRRAGVGGEGVPAGGGEPPPRGSSTTPLPAAAPTTTKKAAGGGGAPAPAPAPTPAPAPRIATFCPNPLSFLLFSWFTPVLSKGYRQPLQQADLPFLLPPLTTAASADAFASSFAARAPSAVAMRAAAAAAAAAGTGEFWPGGQQQDKKKEKKKKAKTAPEKEAVAAAAISAGKSGRPLLGALWQLNKGRLLGSLSLQLIQSAIQFAGPLLLKVIVTYLQAPASPASPAARGRAYGAAAAMFACPLLGALAFVHASRLASMAQVCVRAQLTAGVYRKALRLSPRARMTVEVGRVVNMMSSDVNTLSQFCFPFFNQLVSAPIMLVVALALLWAQIRWGTFIGLAILLASSPASGRFVRKITQLRRAMLVHTDARVRLTNQLLAGIRVLKLYAWEAAQEAAVLDARAGELGRLRAAIPYRVGMQTLLFASPVLAAVASFAAYGSAAPAEFTAPRVFAAIALFSLMRFPLILLPFTLVEAGNAVVSARRLSQFLAMEEREGGAGRGLDPPAWPGGLGIHIVDGQFFWPEAGPPVGGGVGGGGPPGGAGAPSSAADKKAKKGRKGGPKASTDGGGDGGGGGGGGGGDVVVDLTQAGPPGPDAPGGGNGAAPATSAAALLPPSSPKAKHAPGSLAATRASAASTRGGAGAAPAFDPLAAGGPAAYWLRDVNLAVRPGELVCVVGRVGSGKSSLLAAALGEMSRCKDEGGAGGGGSVHCLGGRVAYVAQQAWIANATLKDNILFGAPLDAARWESTLDACCLRPDLAALAAGAETEIGEKGINLSGGQKQRVAVARAVYAGADAFVLDDPLSAVDVHVGATMFADAIAGAMAGSGGGVLLATNQLQFLSRPETTRVIYMENGRIGAQGSFDEVRAASPGLRALLEDFESRASAQQASTAAAATAAGGGGASRGPSLDLAGTDLAVLRAASRGASLDLTAIRRASLEAPRAPAGAGAASPRPPALTTAAAARAARFSRVPTFAIEREARLEALGDAEAGGRGAVGARGGGGAGGLPRLESAFARTGVVVSVDGGEASAVAPRAPNAPPRSVSAALGGLFARGSGRAAAPPRATASAPPPSSSPPASPPSDDSAAAETATTTKGGGGPPPNKNATITAVEDRETGAVGAAVYAFYASRYGWPRVCALLALWAGEQSSRVLTNWWLARWTAAEAGAIRDGTPSPKTAFLSGYLGLSLAFVAFSCGRAAINLLSALRASRVIHAETLAAVVRSPVAFFDATPIGRALNRFSKDTDDMDYLLPQSLSEFGNCLMQLAATLIFISIVQPWFLAGVVPLMGAYFLVQKFYRRSYVELQRTDATTRSPVYAHFSETLTGVDTLRAYGRAGDAAATSAALVDANHRAFFGLKSADQWLSLRLEVVGAALVTLTAVLSIAGKGKLSPSLAALALSESLDVVGFLKYAVMSGAMFEARANAVERLRSYARLAPEAAVESTPEHAPPPGWPTAGGLSFTDVVLRYRPGLEPALRGVSFSLPPGCRAGVVGRTGSGKSSLIVALFRLVEPCGGVIRVDGLNLALLGLTDVRGRIAAIPQDPALFSGTVRSNLDPYGRHTDAELWDALGVVGLKAIVAEAGAAEGVSDAGGAARAAASAAPVRGGLDARVAEGGDNWSVGQRQLLCVSRAVLRRPRLLVLDEATASVDGETDALIQARIRTAFAGATTLTIAHRLNSIIDSDRVLVMEGGLAVEDGTVPDLLRKSGGVFRAMVEGMD